MTMSITATAVAPTRFLNYPGDQTRALGNIVGPDDFLGHWQIVSASYDSETNKTRAGLVPFVHPKADS